MTLIEHLVYAERGTAWRDADGGLWIVDQRRRRHSRRHSRYPCAEGPFLLVASGMSPSQCRDAARRLSAGDEGGALALIEMLRAPTESIDAPFGLRWALEVVP